MLTSPTIGSFTTLGVSSLGYALVGFQGQFPDTHSRQGKRNTQSRLNSSLDLWDPTRG